MGQYHNIKNNQHNIFWTCHGSGKCQQSLVWSKFGSECLELKLKMEHLIFFSASNFFVSDLVIFCQIFLQSLLFFSPQVFMKLVHIKIVFNPLISDVSFKEMIFFSIVLNIFHLQSTLDQLFSTWVIVCVDYVLISVIHLI